MTNLVDLSVTISIDDTSLVTVIDEKVIMTIISSTLKAIKVF